MKRDKTRPETSQMVLRPAHLRALLCLAEARHLVERLSSAYGADYLWPGFSFGHTPIAVFRTDAETFLVQHPDPPDGFHPVRLPIPGLESTQTYYCQDPLPYVPAVGAIEIGGRAAATVPLSVFRASAVPEALVAGLVHEAFHAHLLGLGWKGVDLAPLSRYPELSPANNVLGNLEASILHEYLSARLGSPGAAGEDAKRVAFNFSLVRRERRGPLSDDIIRYEQQLEATEGLARYVEVKTLLGASSGYQPSQAFVMLAGRRECSLARGLALDQLAKLPTVNVNAAGAAWWRFFHTGLALALLADDVDSHWRAGVHAGRALDEIIEKPAAYDGGLQDEHALEALKKGYGYEARLEAERRFGREEKRRRCGLLAGLLGGSGDRITFDVSALVTDDTWWDSGRFALRWDPASVETVTRDVRIHRDGLRFAGFGADLRVDGLPVVEDLKSRLFHVSLAPSEQLTARGDGRLFSLDKPSEFEDGFELILPGVVAKARSGFVRRIGGTLYVKVTR